MSDIVYRELDRLEVENAALRKALEATAEIIFSNFIHAVELGEQDDDAQWIKEGAHWHSDVDLADHYLEQAGYTQTQIAEMRNQLRMKIAQLMMEELESGNEDK